MKLKFKKQTETNKKREKINKKKNVLRTRKGKKRKTELNLSIAYSKNSQNI